MQSKGAFSRQASRGRLDYRRYLARVEGCSVKKKQVKGIMDWELSAYFLHSIHGPRVIMLAHLKLHLNPRVFSV